MNHPTKKAAANTASNKTANADVVSRRIADENARLDRELDALLASQGVNRDALASMATFANALPERVKKQFDAMLEDDYASVPDSPRLSLETLSRPEHNTIISRGLTLLRA
ncbi:MAG: hypothetical protein JRH20_18435 [Deltaproteobacteria bacterium]|nr:hypothetical protein [Deltaproteobacteria bacterium]